MLLDFLDVVAEGSSSRERRRRFLHGDRRGLRFLGAQPVARRRPTLRLALARRTSDHSARFCHTTDPGLITNCSNNTARTSSENLIPLMILKPLTAVRCNLRRFGTSAMLPSSQAGLLRVLDRAAR